MSDNMKLWDSVFETDPAYTKFVKVGRGFTTIDAFYQVRRATEVFGPVGHGWGWETSETYTDGLVIVKMHLWYRHPDTGEVGRPVVHFGCKALANKSGRVNEDAVKSATTDALTKALSFIGFNGDVFMGKFDDNKYVEEMRNKYDERNSSESETSVEQSTLMADLTVKITTAHDLRDLESLRPQLADAKGKLSKKLVRELSTMYINRQNEFGETK